MKTTRIVLSGAVIAACGFVLTARVPAGDEGSADVQQRAWERLRELAGHWGGSGSGMPGTGTVDREYQVILHDQFVFVRNESRFEPQDKNPKGEVHHDWGFYSFDKTRKKVVLREFNGEGYVNQYVLDEIGDDGKRLTFVTESVENGMPGFRARIIIHLDGKNAIREDFDLAFPGKDFKTCVKNKLTKS